MNIEEMQKAIARMNENAKALEFLRTENHEIAITVNGRSAGGQPPYLGYEAEQHIARLLANHLREATQQVEAALEEAIENDRLKIVSLAK